MPRKSARLATVGRKVSKNGPTRAANGVRQNPRTFDSSDAALTDLLKRLKATADPTEIAQISDQIERVIFHRQFENA